MHYPLRSTPMVQWQELLPNEFWQIDDFLTDGEIQRLIQSCRDCRTIFVSTVGDPGKPRLARSHYEYHEVKNDFFKNTDLQDIRIKIIDQLNQIYHAQSDRSFEQFPDDEMQIFTKYFQAGENGHYFGIHVECPKVFGPFAFVLYLTDDPTGILHFFNEQEEQHYLETHPQEREDYLHSVKLMRENGHPLHYIGPLSIAPVKGRLITFRTGSPHITLPLTSSTNELPRLSITGWPFTTAKRKGKRPTPAPE